MRLGARIIRSKIVNHNELLPAYKVKFCKAIVEQNLPKRIFDVGCGLGYTTQQIKIRYPRAKVIGIDASNVSVEFGRG
jgi:trans-aconitate methyltransferase